MNPSKDQCGRQAMQQPYGRDDPASSWARGVAGAYHPPPPGQHFQSMSDNVIEQWKGTGNPLQKSP